MPLRFSPHILKIITNDPSGVQRGDLLADFEHGFYYAPSAIAAIVFGGRLALIKPAN